MQCSTDFAELLQRIRTPLARAQAASARNSVSATALRDVISRTAPLADAQPPIAACGCMRCWGRHGFVCAFCETCAGREWLPSAATCMRRMPCVPLAIAASLVWVDLRAAYSPELGALLAAVMNEAANVRGLLLSSWPVTDADLQLGHPERIEILGVPDCTGLTLRVFEGYTGLRMLDVRGCFLDETIAALGTALADARHLQLVCIQSAAEFWAQTSSGTDTGTDAMRRPPSPGPMSLPAIIHSWPHLPNCRVV
jgi:hypothetical protein